MIGRNISLTNETFPVLADWRREKFAEVVAQKY